MSKFELILKHFDLEKRKKRSIKKVIRRTEDEKKTKNAQSHGRATNFKTQQS